MFGVSVVGVREPGNSDRQHLDLIPLDPDRERLDAGLAPRAVEPSAVFERESPAVPGTGHGFVADEAVAKGGALMGAGVFEGVIGPPVEEDGDHPVADLEESALAFGDLADLGDCLIGA